MQPLMQPLNIMSINIRSIISKLPELIVLIEQNDIHIVLCQESWLDTSIPQVILPNFIILSRRDRSSKPNRGGIITFLREDVKNAVFLKHANSAERSWHFNTT